MKSKKEKMGSWLIAVGMLFFFNPNVNIIDFLPDFIGYMLLCAGLSKWADLNETIGEATERFRRMIFVDAAKWVALLWVFGLSVTNERTSSLLLWSFVFSVLELVFLMPAYAKLFEGLTQLGYSYPNTAIFGSGRKKRSPTDKIRMLTLFFVAWKAVFSTLPEFADLSNSSYDETSGMVNLYRYIGIMRFLAFVLVLAVGLVWLIAMQRYLHKIRRDSEFMEAMRTAYQTQIRPKEGLFIRRRFHTVYIFLIMALVLTLDFHVESQNILPDVLAATVFLLIGLFLLSYFRKKMIPWLAAGAFYWITALCQTLAEQKFFDQFYYGAIYKSEEAMSAYRSLVICTVCQTVSFLLLLWCVIRILYRIIEEHTGYVKGQASVGESERGMILSLQKEEKRSLLVAYAVSAVYGISDICYVLLAPTVGVMGVLHTGMALLCIAFFVRALSGIQTAIRTKYMLE